MKKTAGPRIIFWGTPEFAILSLGTLVQNGYNVVAVITNPDEPKGRKQMLTPPPVKSFILKHETWSKTIKILQPKKLDDDFRLQISGFKPDVFVVAAYGKFLPKEILDIPQYGAINIHPSLLPRWRGPSPIQYAILEGDREAGATIMLIDEKMDHGPIIANSKFKIQNSKFTYQELHDMLAEAGAKLLIETLPKWIRGEIKPMPQDDTKATLSKLLKKEDGRIDWTKSAIEIERMVRAFEVWPGSFTYLTHGDKLLRLEIEKADAVPDNHPSRTPGLLWQKASASLLVQTGQGSLLILQLKPEGKKSLSAPEFLNGYKNAIGAVLP